MLAAEGKSPEDLQARTLKANTSLFLNWAGGKTKLLPQLLPLVPKQFQRYIEPFLGGGSLFFSLSPEKAILSDSNDELINCHIVVRDSVEELIARLGRLPRDRSAYDILRQQKPESISSVERATRFIYLNKTCYNGLYRVNSQGHFNVPYGRRTAPIFDPRKLRLASRRLANIQISARDFEEALKDARAGDFVYLDPPYYPISSTSSFTKYTSIPFDVADHKRLKEAFVALDERGCYILLTNSDCEFIRGLYAGFRHVTIRANRYVNCAANGRGKLDELAIMNYVPSC